jgi:hypothetical protein
MIRHIIYISILLCEMEMGETKIALTPDWNTYTFTRKEDKKNP